MTEAEKRINNLITAIESGFVTPATKSALEKVEADKAVAEAALSRLARSRFQPPILDPEQIIARYKTRLEDFGNNLGTNLPKARGLSSNRLGKRALPERRREA